MRIPDPVLLVVAVFSRHEAARRWAGERLEQVFGPVALASREYDFSQTRYYEPTMGPALRKHLLASHDLVAPDCLPDAKRRTNALEQELADAGTYPEPRPLNLDPGYLTEAKLVLATTKDRDHRLYLDRGIYAENTLFFHRGAWQARPWTYPDYQRPDYHQFFLRCRDFLRQKYARG